MTVADRKKVVPQGGRVGVVESGLECSFGFFMHCFRCHLALSVIDIDQSFSHGFDSFYKLFLKKLNKDLTTTR